MMSGPREKVLDLRAVFGLEARITASAAATGGEYVEMDVTAEPGSRTMIHYHPRQEENYRVLEGTLKIYLEDRWRCERVSLSPCRRERYTGSETRARRRSGSSTCTVPRSASRSTWRRWTA